MTTPQHTPEDIRAVAAAIVQGLKGSYPSLTVDLMEEKVKALLSGTPAKSLGIMGMWAEESLREIRWLKAEKGDA